MVVLLARNGHTSNTSLSSAKLYMPEAQKMKLFRNDEAAMCSTVPRVMTASPSSPAIFDSNVHPLRATRTPECRRAPPRATGCTKKKSIGRRFFGAAMLFSRSCQLKIDYFIEDE